MKKNYLMKAMLPVAALCFGLMPPVGLNEIKAGVASVQQIAKVSGTVVDKSGPVIGATIKVKGTSIATVSDLDGNFTLVNVPKNAIIEVTYIGYTTKEVALNGKTNLKITIEEEASNLDEVVVVGYGLQKKSDVTGALARVGEKELKAMPVKNALEGMQGKVAGVDITSSQRPGQIGGIQIRGVRSISAGQGPLYVVDGMIIQNGGIENINPSDIESIDVLKDASATAVYGSRGANGVVLVTTKKGKSGKLSVNYSGTVTFETMHDVQDMMTAAEWLQYARIAKANMGSYNGGNATPNYEADKKAFGSVAASWANIEKAWEGGTYDASKVGSYDWTSGGRQTGITHEHTLSASGGSEKFQGYLSFGYLNQTGVQPGQEYERYTLKTSFDIEPVDFLKLGSSINGSYSDQDYGYSFSKSVTGAGDYYSALRGMLPWTVPYDDNGDYIRNPNGDVNIINPIRELDYNTNQRRTFRANASLYAQVDFGKIWEPLNGLSYRFQFGPEFQYYTLGIANAADGINGDGNNGAQYNNSQKRSWTLDNLIYYNRKFADKHNLNITLMQSASKYHYEYGDMRATNVATADELWYNMATAGTLKSFGTGLTETQMASYMARVNYGFMDKYLLTASIRWDGASQLAAGHKWASFPSFALAWRIDQEEFMKDFKALSQLKLRLGYGVTGNAAIAAYATKGAIQSSYYNWGQTDSSIGYVPSDASAKTPNKMANQDLSWERTTQYNLGVDYGFFNNRLSGSFDIYKTKTKDLLLAMTIPSLTGYTSTYANVGETSGWGIDLQINAIPVMTKDFTWNTSLTWSMDRNKIDKLSNGRTEDVNNRWFVGEEIGVYYDYVYDGIWKTAEADQAAEYGRKPGQIHVKDVDGNGKIDANDRSIVGYSRPRWTAGWTNTFNYKNFELSFFIISRWDFTVPQGSLTLDGRFMQRDIDYWVAGTNENALYYSPGSNGESADTYASSMNYQDGSFIKVRNISLGYNFTPKQLKPLGLSNLKVYVQAMNPFSIYKACKWLDTDLVNYDNNTTTLGSPYTLRSFVVGLNIGF